MNSLGKSLMRHMSAHNRTLSIQCGKIVYPPPHKISEYPSIEEGFVKSPNSTFIVRKCKEFDATAVMKGIEKKAATGYTVSANTQYDEHCEKSTDGLPLKKLLADYKNNTLGFKILNSVTHIIDLPQVLLDYHKPVIPTTVTPTTEEPLLQSIILSPVGKTTLHLDVVEYGGVFMYLCEGEKEWSFMEPIQNMPALYDAKNRRLFDKELPCDARTEGGDFVYFPPGELHRVVTTKKMIGISGYIVLEACSDRRKKLLKFLEDYDITGII